MNVESETGDADFAMESVRCREDDFDVCLVAVCPGSGYIIWEPEPALQLLYPVSLMYFEWLAGGLKL